MKKGDKVYYKYETGQKSGPYTITFIGMVNNKKTIYLDKMNGNVNEDRLEIYNEN